MKYEIKTTIDIDFKYLIEEFKETVKDMILDELNADYEDYLEEDINRIMVLTAKKIIKNYGDKEEG